jgi:asparagine synthase (glutamine-hydrolysing)
MVFDFESGNATIWRYWELPPPGTHDTTLRNEEERLNELEVLLENSVRSQLVSDVPVGVLLSGGVDSSLVTALAARSAPGVHTFTVRFPGHGAYDETAHARLIATHFGTDHVEIDATEAMPELLMTLARQVDEPINDSSLIPTYLISQTVRSRCIVALGGDGGDELFGGYGHYRRLLRMRRTMGHAPHFVRHGIAAAAAYCLPVGARGRTLLQSTSYDYATETPPIPLHFDSRARRKILGKFRDCQDAAEAIRAKYATHCTNVVEAATRTDFGMYLPEDILVKVDRSSMLASLEVRAPFLDQQLIEFAFSRVPTFRKCDANSGKIILKSLAKRILPPQFDVERKQGFSMPLADWLQGGPWLNTFSEVLLDPGSTLFDRDATASLLRGQARGRSNRERLFGLVMLELWRREYRISATPI